MCTFPACHLRLAIDPTISQDELMLKAIVAERLIDGTGRAPLANPIVLIRHGRIEAVHSGALSELGLEEEVEVIEDPASTILPGLIDAHVHLAFRSELPSSPEIINHLLASSQEMMGMQILSNAQDALRAGITTVRDCGARGLSVLEVRDAIRAGVVAGPRILACGMPVTTTAGHLHWCGLEADGVNEVRKAARWLIKSGADFIKVMSTGGGMTPGSNSLRAQYSVEELAAIAQEAHRLGKHVAAHANGTEGIRNSVRAGIDGIEHCHWRTMEGEDYDPEVVAQMVEQGTFLDKNLHVISARGLPVPEVEIWVEKARDALSRHRQMIAAGVRLVLCTDAGGPHNGFDTLPWVVALARRLLDIEPMQAIVSSTSLPALELGLQDEIGTIEPGKRADLILVKGNPLEDLFCLTRVEKVFKDGAEVASDGRLCLPGQA